MLIINAIVLIVYKVFPVWAVMSFIQWHICKREEKRKWFWILPVISFVLSSGVYIGYLLLFQSLFQGYIEIIIAIVIYLLFNTGTMLLLLIYFFEKKHAKSNQMQKKMKIQDL